MNDRTYLSEVYDSFLGSVSDYTLLASIQQGTIEEDLFTYFKGARSQFYKCKKPLSLLEDGEGSEYFGYQEERNNQIINEVVKLSDFEISVIVKLMIVEYLKPLILSTEILKQALSDKDFRIYSQANQLREMSQLYAKLKKEAKSAITEYTYIGMTENER